MSMSRYRARYKSNASRVASFLSSTSLEWTFPRFFRNLGFHATMKAQLLFLVVFACVFLFAAAVPTKVCEPGTSFKKDCNECKCNVDGTDMACTRKICTGSEDGVEPAPEQKEGEQNDAEAKQDEVDESDRCVPGELFKKDCNNCSCPPSGLKSAGACTLLACYHDIEKD